jgi:GAF domain-containing protein
MLAQNHRLKIGASGIVGYVTQTGQPRIALDVSRDTAHFHNPLLPDTRSEMTLPLISGGRIIGALDVQSVMEAAFDSSDIQTMQTLADQLAVAIDNVRQIESTQESLNELNALYKDQARKTWKQVAQARPTAFEYDGLNIVAGRRQLPADILEQLSGGQSVILRDSPTRKKAKTGGARATLLVPLMLQGQLIGTVGIEKADPNHEWTQDELSMAESVATQASLALENARLLEETQRRAAKERTIGEISARIGGLVDIDKILQATVQELSQTLSGAEVAIQFQPKDQG